MAATARDEMDTLLDLLLTFGQQMLNERGGFYPYAAAIDAEGKPVMIGGWTGDEHPDTTELLELLCGGLRTQPASGEIRASGVAMDVRIRQPDGEGRGDAIKVALEHEEAEPVDVFLPYTSRRLRGVEYGELFAVPGESEIFTGS